MSSELSDGEADVTVAGLDPVRGSTRGGEVVRLFLESVDGSMASLSSLSTVWCRFGLKAVEGNVERDARGSVNAQCILPTVRHAATVLFQVATKGDDFYG